MWHKLNNNQEWTRKDRPTNSEPSLPTPDGTPIHPHLKAPPSAGPQQQAGGAEAGLCKRIHTKPTKGGSHTFARGAACTPTPLHSPPLPSTLIINAERTRTTLVRLHAVWYKFVSFFINGIQRGRLLCLFHAVWCMFVSLFIHGIQHARPLCVCLLYGICLFLSLSIKFIMSWCICRRYSTSYRGAL